MLLRRSHFSLNKLPHLCLLHSLSNLTPFHLSTVLSPSVSTSLMSSATVTVVGAGTDEVNGVYEQASSSVFNKVGLGTASIQFNAEAELWTITDCSDDSGDDKVLYSATAAAAAASDPGSSGSGLPVPSSGWIVEEAGTEPAPSGVLDGNSASAKKLALRARNAERKERKLAAKVQKSSKIKTELRTGNAFKIRTCKVCNIETKSPQDWALHVEGKQHKKNLEEKGKEKGEEKKGNVVKVVAA